ncbi:DUF2973 domain-containing protein [Roseofilum sp. BLCC_M154]|uniref:DUF2973 domain-containing protein n=1 Tax=Roseofilum acuticapitatum BLCC-M154 TaxID=3022444 RepID=A0ABT7ASB9_9CYAN|nr:DUF2973 domain-containing protein [Roseofilum acuticapitatum]MDJ1169795.1 DUF2973 domain-containing protein [Roseofilum acuticapitatum BLCC-M154]
MLHLLYVFAFTTLAFIAVGNLIRNLMILGSESTRNTPPKLKDIPIDSHRISSTQVPHPEFLDETGMVIKEPLLVMRSITVEDAREKLDALYNSSPESSPKEDRGEI